VRQAVRVADGVITNWLSARTSGRSPRSCATKLAKWARIRDLSDRLPDQRLPDARGGCRAAGPRAVPRAVTAYLNVPVYRRFHHGSAVARRWAR